MIDAHTHINSLFTWPADYVERYDAFKGKIDGKCIRSLTSDGMGKFLVELNSKMYLEEAFVPEILSLRKQQRNGSLDDNEERRLRDLEILWLLDRKQRSGINRREQRRSDELREEQRQHESQGETSTSYIPSLIIASTMDMEFAYFDENIRALTTDEALPTPQITLRWDHQIREIEQVVHEYPLRIFPLFSYDPRRYRLSDNDIGGDGDYSPWDKPFQRIAGSGNHSAIWLGFEMNPFLGFRPFDELYMPLLLRFYEKCERNNFPILTHCAPDAITTHKAELYKRSDEDKNIIKKRISWVSSIISLDEGEWREIENFEINNEDINHRRRMVSEFYPLSLNEREWRWLGSDIEKIGITTGDCQNSCGGYSEKCRGQQRGCIPESSIYAGKENIIDNSEEEAEERNHFYKYYGHPQNWNPVLERFPKLHLCFAGFGGNSEWKHESMKKWAMSTRCVAICHACVHPACKGRDIWLLPPREIIRSMILLACKYPNVYIDMSGLDISDDYIKKGLKKLLPVLKHKLIFGSNWYLTNISNRNVEYGRYCYEFKRFFDEFDGERRIYGNDNVTVGESWERVSLINPWLYYALTDDKIRNISSALGTSGSTAEEKILELNNTILTNKINELEYDISGEIIPPGKHFCFIHAETVTDEQTNTSEMRRVGGSNRFSDPLFEKTLRIIKDINEQNMNLTRPSLSMDKIAIEGLKAINEISKYYYCEISVAIYKNRHNERCYLDIETMIYGTEKYVDALKSRERTKGDTVAFIHTHVIDKDFFFSGTDYRSSFENKVPLYMKNVYSDEIFWRTDPLSMHEEPLKDRPVGLMGPSLPTHPINREYEYEIVDEYDPGLFNAFEIRNIENRLRNIGNTKVEIRVLKDNIFNGRQRTIKISERRNP
ncbi:MAG: hypothetical protein LBU83_09845 [Bacteroidales bacterium]|jgi:hypothetical protein|nr:hypothetical protein [Bacteroidales bacterium]